MTWQTCPPLEVTSSLGEGVTLDHLLEGSKFIPNLRLRPFHKMCDLDVVASDHWICGHVGSLKIDGELTPCQK